MAVEVLLTFALKVPPSGVPLQEALDRASVPVLISDAPSLDLQKHSGFLPVKYKSLDSGFYVYQWTPKELEASYPETKSLRPRVRLVVSFQFGGDPLECVSVMRTASVLIEAFGARPSILNPGALLVQTISRPSLSFAKTA